MKVSQLPYFVCAVLLVFPLLSSAQIYKWKDKDGVVRYSDTLPSDNIEAKIMGKERFKSDTNNEETEKTALENKRLDTEDAVDPEDAAARLRQRNAEIDKKNKIEAEKQAKLDAENCRAAKANYQQFAQGGRIYKTNERGEREYYNDADLAAGKQRAQNKINQYCK